MRRTKNSMKGITLIGLVITIILLLILGGITINLVISDNGVIKKAKDARNNTIDAKNRELAGLNNLNKKIDEIIDKEQLPYKQTIYDTNPIPDIHNTGCHGDLTNASDLEITPGALSTYIRNKKVNVFENIAFYDNIYINKNASTLGFTEIIFKNCLIYSNNYYCIQLSNSDVSIKCENCTFTNANSAVNSAGNMTFKNCYAYNMKADCWKLYSNVKLINCYAGSAGFNSGAHADGVQFSSGEGFYVDNYRCDGIALKDTNVYNSAFYVDFELGDTYETTEAIAQNLYLNGGGYTMYLINADGYTLKNVNISNAQCGCSRRFGRVNCSPQYTSFIDNGKYVDAKTAYVSSVWKENGAIKFCVTNYTNQERKLIIKTSNETSTITIPACPTYDEYYDTYTSLDQFPFNLDYSVPNADWIVIYDTTEAEENQIRFVDFR